MKKKGSVLFLVILVVIAVYATVLIFITVPDEIDFANLRAAEKRQLEPLVEMPEVEIPSTDEIVAKVMDIIDGKLDTMETDLYNEVSTNILKNMENGSVPAFMSQMADLVAARIEIPQVPASVSSGLSKEDIVKQIQTYVDSILPSIVQSVNTEMKNNFEADYLPLITASLEKTIQDKVDASVATSEQPVGDNVKAELYNTLYNELSSTLSTQIYDNLLTTLSANISNEIATEVEASLLKENDIETITVPSTPTVEPETETTTPEIVSEEPAEESVIPETVSEEPVVESVTPVIEEEPVVETVTPAEVSTVSTEPQEMTQEEYIIKRKEARTTAISDILAGLQD